MNNSLLKELSRGICYYINNPSTFVNFALTCRRFALVCREYAPMKKNEFRVTIRQWMKMFTPKEPQHIQSFLPSNFDISLVLPNGMLHGICNCGGYDNDYDYVTRIDTGKVMHMYDGKTTKGLLGNGQTMYFLKQIIVTGNFIQFYCNLHSEYYIISYPCNFCKKRHSFQRATVGLASTVAQRNA